NLRGLGSYNHRHNEANGEGNKDGADGTNSWNCGVEGPTDDPGIRALRLRQRKNFMATLLLSQGVPMILAGDELSHTQRGNNNTYCQDNEITWLDWDLDTEKQEFLEFVKKLVALRDEQPVLQRRSFFQGRGLRGSDIRDVSFFEPSGEEMTDEAWSAGFVRCLGVRWAGNLIGELDERGEVITGDTLFILMNAHHETIPFTLPPHEADAYWDLLLQTADVTQEELHPGQAGAVGQVTAAVRA